MTPQVSEYLQGFGATYYPGSDVGLGPNITFVTDYCHFRLQLENGEISCALHFSDNLLRVREFFRSWEAAQSFLESWLQTFHRRCQEHWESRERLIDDVIDSFDAIGYRG